MRSATQAIGKAMILLLRERLEGLTIPEEKYRKVLDELTEAVGPENVP